MSEQIKTWLAHEFKRLVSVQTTKINGHADVIIYLWSGVKIRVHLVNQSVKMRAMKRVLQDATDIGIGSMFLVDATLLPEDGKRVELPDWLLAIHTLNAERVYCYRKGENSYEIFQMHFESLTSSSEYKTWHGPAVDFDKMRFFRVSTKPRLIKGDWLIADFGSSAFWKNTDYRFHRESKDRPYQRKTEWQEYSAYQTWSGTYQRQNGNGNGATSARPMQDYLVVCYNILGIEEKTPQDEAKRAFRKLAITYHPDTSVLPAEEAEEKFRALNAAYEYVKAAKGWS